MISVEFTNSDLSGVGKNYQSTQQDEIWMYGIRKWLNINISKPPLVDFFFEKWLC